MPKPSIFIATPAYRGSATSSTMQSVVKLTGALTEKQIPWSMWCIDFGDTALARDMLATHFLKATDATHVLFADPDQTFEPGSVARLVKAGKPFIGCLCPERSYDLDAIINEARSNPDNKSVIAKSMKFVTEKHLLGPADADGIAPTKFIGMGLTLIERQVFERLAPQVRAVTSGLKPETLAAVQGSCLRFFEQPADGDYYASEDGALCTRWRGIGGEVFALTTEIIGHIGTVEFRGRYADTGR